MNKIYLYNFNNYEIKDTFCDLRNLELANVSNKKIKAQKYYAWKVLEYAVKKSLNLEPKDITFSKTENGKWITDDFYFSISHSENLVAVAISLKPVGVDVQIEVESLVKGFEKKILSNEELEEFNLLQEDKKLDFLLKKWTEKESVFKLYGESVCRYKSLNSKGLNSINLKVEIEDKRYYLHSVFKSQDGIQFEQISSLNDL